MTVRQTAIDADLATADASVSVPVTGTGSSGYLPSAESRRADRIEPSEAALESITGGHAPRAYVILGFEDVRRRIAMDAQRALVVESGCYGIVAT